jgi:hypothetical protein
LRKAIRRNFYNSSNRHYSRTKKNGLLTTEFLTDGEGDHCADKTPDVIDGGYCGEEIGLAWTDEVVKAEKVLSYDDTTC